MERTLSKQRIACIVGPTACGKTALALRVAARCGAEIVSADSVQVYRGLDIGSAKPTERERRAAPHHLIDCVEPENEAFSVSQYRDLADAAIGDIAGRGRFPLVVGGSGLYVNALVYPLKFAVPSDRAVRAALEQDYPPEDTARAWTRLRQVDPATADRLHPNDRKRIIRALEVYRLSGRPLSSFGNDFSGTAGRPMRYDALMIGLTMERALLYERIDARVDRMMEAGLLEEARALAQRGLSRRLPALQSLGYRQLLDYLDGACTLPQAVAAIKQETRRFAKRQLSWFRRDGRIRWYDASALPEAELADAVAKKIINWKERGENE